MASSTTTASRCPPQASPGNISRPGYPAADALADGDGLRPGYPAADALADGGDR
jgi:hypothetical protein